MTIPALGFAVFTVDLLIERRADRRDKRAEDAEQTSAIVDVATTKQADAPRPNQPSMHFKSWRTGTCGPTLAVSKRDAMTWADVQAWMEHAAPGLNLSAVVDLTIGGWVFAGLLGDEFRKPSDERSDASVDYFTLITISMWLSVIWRGCWQPYYLAVSIGASEWAAWFLRNQGISTLAGVRAGIPYALHARYNTGEQFGPTWLFWILGALLLAFAVGRGCLWSSRDACPHLHHQ